MNEVRPQGVLKTIYQRLYFNALGTYFYILIEKSSTITHTKNLTIICQVTILDLVSSPLRVWAPLVGKWLTILEDEPKTIEWNQTIPTRIADIMAAWDSKAE
jgi:hypothetical protein